MSYRVAYGPPIPEQYQRKPGKPTIQVMTAVFLLLFVLLVKTYHPAGTQKLQELLLPGTPSVTQQALDELVTDLRGGDPLDDAFTAFCRQIVEHDQTLSD